jgi:hypothetical protein
MGLRRSPLMKVNPGLSSQFLTFSIELLEIVEDEDLGSTIHERIY